MNWTAFIVFVALFALVTVMGFHAGRWRRGDLGLINEWGLAGRRLGTLVTWFLLNVALSVCLTPVFNALLGRAGDETAPFDYQEA